MNALPIIVALLGSLGGAKPDPIERIFQHASEVKAQQLEKPRRGINFSFQELRLLNQPLCLHLHWGFDLAEGELASDVLDDKYVLQEADGSQSSHPPTRRYHYAAQPLAATNGAITSYLNVDALGSVTDATSIAGSVTSGKQYDAWGQYRNGTAPTPTEPKLGFTGHQFDVETGLVYARARYYDPELGRFLSRDSLEGDVDDAPSLHRYAYVRQNPTRYTDFEGLADDKPTEKEAEPSVHSEAEPYLGKIYQQEVSKLSQEDLAKAVRKVALLSWSSGSLEGKTHQELVGLLCGYMQCKTSDVAYILSLVKDAASENGAKFGDFVSSRPIVQKAGHALKTTGVVIEEAKEAVSATVGDKIADATSTPGAVFGSKVSQTFGDLGKRGARATLDIGQDYATGKGLAVAGGIVVGGLGKLGGALAGEGAVVGAVKRAPIFADSNVLIAAAEKGHAGALAEIRAGITLITPNQYREFLNVTQSGQVASRRAFLLAERIQVIGGPGAGEVAATEGFQAIFKAVKPAQGRGDAALAAFAGSTGYEAVTMERRLANYLNLTQPQLGVPVRVIR